MVCDPKCWSTASIHGPSGRRLMISKGGPGSKFPAETHHGMCDECLQDLLEDAKLGILFNNDVEMIQRYKKLMKEFK